MSAEDCEQQYQNQEADGPANVRLADQQVKLAARTPSGGDQCLSFGSGPGEDRRHAVNVLAQFVADLLPQWIQKELHTFTPCKLCRRHEIAVTRHENKRINLTLESHAGDIQTNTHIYSLLAQPKTHVALTDIAQSRHEVQQFTSTGIVEYDGARTLQQ